ncbi:hypothetical protein IW492_02915 [Enterococcus sp. BWB1-3]|uniref:hypothetical protein n=1 Tax=Enterococcus sp. BWB1-3 TaxID=2787713 RepID=UPI001922B91F|nr:hypothetical protein [Enterococcus sp. BWB1-3]MBL1228183.1 hypothetical protein [Enterococcus sp. BWB1-3]
MTKILINRIVYKNFKGISHYELDLNSQDAKAFGRNASGKTTLADGFRWLLFGKNLSDEKLNPKPLDSDNKEQLGLNPEVEAEISIDGKIVILKRVQEEKWTTKRSSIEKTRGSDTTKYFIDTVPVKEKEWKVYISKIADEALFSVLSNPGTFMKLPWKTRRELLIELSGMTDEKIISKNESLKDLSKVLDGHSVDDKKKILAEQKKQIKQQIEGIPLQIQENKDAIDRLTLDEQGQEIDVQQFKTELNSVELLIKEKEERLQISKNGDPALDYQEQISKLNIQLNEEKNKFLAGGNLATGNLQTQVFELQKTVNELRSKKSQLEVDYYQTEQTVKLQNEELESLRSDHKQLSSLTFDEHQKECPTCGQDLPEDQVAQMVEKFNQDKSDKLEKNVETGKAKRQVFLVNNAKLLDLNEERKIIESQLSDKEKGLDLLNDELTFQQSKNGKFEDTESYKQVKQEIDELQNRVLTAQADSSLAIQEAQQALEQAIKQKEQVQAQLMKFDQVKPFEDRIADIRKKDAELKQQNQDVERQLFMIDEFIRLKVKMLEESINSKFELVKFKLFDVQKNGALNEVCEATYEGIEYSSSLNTGAKINCDIDIVNTLSKHHDLYLPLFVDNAEAVNELIESESQVIELRVSDDKKLKVEV